MLHTVVLWGLVTNYWEGGLQHGKGGGGASEVLPLQKREWKNVLAMLKWGDKKSFEVVLTWRLEVLAIVMGGAQKFSTL